MAGYQTGRSLDDLMKCVWSQEVSDCITAENNIKKALEPWLESHDREMVRGLFLMNLIQKIDEVL
jgi:hypothetical protein